MKPDEMQGHEERYGADVPPLWSTMSRVHPAAWGLPASTISVFSALTWMLVFVILALPPSAHATFRLPDDGLLGLLASLAIAFVVTLVGSRRPGPIFPRLWALALTFATLGFVIALGLGLLGTGPLPAALSVATFAASFVLAARLLRMHPDSRLLRRVAPLTAAAVVLVMVPAALAVQHHYEGQDRGSVQAVLDDIAARKASVEALAPSGSLDGWPELGPGLEAGLVAARALDAQRRSTREAELIAAYEGLLGTIRTAATRADAPWTAAVIANRPPTRHTGRDSWELEPGVAAAVGDARPYHAALEDALEASRGTGERERAWQDAKTLTRGESRRRALANAWAFDPELGLGALLAAPIAATGPPSFSDIAGIFAIDRAAAVALKGADTGCRWVDQASVDWLECFGFLPAGGGAPRLALVGRILYSTGNLPAELYVLLLPADRDTSEDDAHLALKAWADATAGTGSEARYLDADQDRAARYRTGFCAIGSSGSFVAERVRSAANTTVRLEDGTPRTGLVVEVTRAGCPH